MSLHLCYSVMFFDWWYFRALIKSTVSIWNCTFVKKDCKETIETFNCFFLSLKVLGCHLSASHHFVLCGFRAVFCLNSLSVFCVMDCSALFSLTGPFTSNYVNLTLVNFPCFGFYTDFLPFGSLLHWTFNLDIGNVKLIYTSLSVLLWNYLLIQTGNNCPTSVEISTGHHTTCSFKSVQYCELPDSSVSTNTSQSPAM